MRLVGEKHGEAWTGDVTNRHGVGWRHRKTQTFRDLRTLWVGQMDGLNKSDRDASLKALGPWRWDGKA